MKDSNKSLIDTAAGFVESVLPEVQSALSDAMKTGDSGPTSQGDADAAETAPVAEDSVASADAESTGKGARGLIALLVIGGLIAIAAVVIQRILSGRSDEEAGDNWTSSYTPTPPDAESEDEGEGEGEESPEAVEESDESSA